MSRETWTEVDRYIGESFVPADAALETALAESQAAGLPAIAVSAPQGKLLHLLARAQRAHSILEIGTLGGYSTLWLARALPEGGKLVTLEREPKHAEVARANIARAGLASRVEIRVGTAIDSLRALVSEKRAPFDFVFIDADKPSLPEYFTWSLRLARRGSVLVIDNVVREGEVTHADSADEAVQGVRRMNERIAAEPRVSATTIQTVGAKGYDGFTLALVVGD